MKRQISEINHRGFTAVLTCSSHPEQYDVYYGNMTVGYLRIRDNVFYGQYPGCGGETIYMAYPSEKYSLGDGQLHYVMEALETFANFFTKIKPDEHLQVTTAD